MHTRLCINQSYNFLYSTINKYSKKANHFTKLETKEGKMCKNHNFDFSLTFVCNAGGHALSLLPDAMAMDRAWQMRSSS